MIEGTVCWINRQLPRIFFCGRLLKRVECVWIRKTSALLPDWGQVDGDTPPRTSFIFDFKIAVKLLYIYRSWVHFDLCLIWVSCL